MDLQGFRKPKSILRPAPFWAINDRITPEETARQMADMISVGLSGGFFHSRAGLITDYLSDEWFDSMKAAVKAANENDGYLWLYDEDLWPSGNAGGQVASMKDEYRDTTLDGILVPAGEAEPVVTEDQAIRHCYAIKSREGLTIKDIESVPLDKLADARQYERLFLVRTYGPKIAWWSGESYSNLLHPEVTQEFIKLTHDEYFKKLGSEFGKRIPGIFTDEPNIPYKATGMPWYEGLPESYKKWHNRDLWADLPYMFFNGEEAARKRLLIHRTVLRQFVESYSRPLYEWCEKHGIDHTGHFLQEDSFSWQIMFNYGGIMAHYRYQQIPGVDHLCRQVNEALYVCKQVASAARQLGRNRVLTEIFGVSRHTNTFEDFKWIGNFDLVLGPNFFCPHLTWYSARGKRKRDYPPVWNYQQTYWKDLNLLNDYFTRVAHALTSGKAEANILMLHSIENATAGHRLGVEVRSSVTDGVRKMPVDAPTEDFGPAHHYDAAMRKMFEAILHAGYECDFGDEGYIEDLGSVQGDSFIIGEMSYKVVVIPPSFTWRPKTLELLKKFTANGGKVVILGDTPTQLDCVDAKAEWMGFATDKNVISLPYSIESIQTTLDEIAPKTFSLRSVDGKAVPYTYLQHRIDGDQEIFFIVNAERNIGKDYVLTFMNGKGKSVTKWNPVEGTCEKVAVCEVGDELRYNFHIPSAGSLLITLGGDVEGSAEESKAINLKCKSASIQTLPSEFEFARLDDNVLVMDRLSVSFDGGKTFEAEDMDHHIRVKVANNFGTTESLQWQPWVAIRKGLFDGKGGEIILRYCFSSELDKPKASIVIEDIQKGILTVNGTQVDVSNPGWHWDRGFGKVEITDLVKKGENIVDFKVNYDFLTEVEAAYVVGDFGVDLADLMRGKIVAEPKKLKLGSWSDQGYLFYPGRMVYKTSFEAQEGKKSILRLINPSGILFKVKVNGQEAGRIPWRPYELDLTSFAKPGVNQLEIEVVSSLQNSWGPLHEKNGDDNLWCGPNAFEDDNFLREEICSFNYGLLGRVEIVSV